MKLKLTNEKIKGGMKFRISPTTNLCRKKGSYLDCALNVIDTLTGRRFSEQWQYRVNKYYPKAFARGRGGMNDLGMIEALAKLLPEMSIRDRNLFFRKIEVLAGVNVIHNYYTKISLDLATKLNEHEGLILHLSNDYNMGHIVVLANLDGLPHIIDKQVQGSPFDLDDYYRDYILPHWKYIFIIEDDTYKDKLKYMRGVSEGVLEPIDQTIVSKNPLHRLPSDPHGYETDDDIDLQDEVHGNTALINATIANDEKFVTLFLTKYRANPNIQNINGWTALAVACIKGFENISNILVTNGADFNLANTFGDTPLILACLQGNKDIVKMLIDKQTNINKRNNAGQTPFFWACYNDHKDIVKMLITAEADVNIPDNMKNTPLHWACEKNNDFIVKILLEAGADVNVQDEDGKTPLHLACINGNKTIVKMLVEVVVLEENIIGGADTDIQDKNGRTPLDIATENGYTQIIKILTKTSKGGKTGKKKRRTRKQRKTKKNSLM
jgi:ankyrin repeat protein